MRVLGRYALRWVGLLLLAALLALWGGVDRGRAGEVSAPTGMTLLTVGGEVANWNRGPVHEKRDGFLAFHEIRFNRAMAFDRAMLDALEQGRVTAAPPQVPGPAVFTGPTLKALLTATGTDPETLLVLALDGYAVELSRADRVAQDWIVATEVDGRPLPIGGTGPLWLVHSPAQGPAPSEEEEQRWVWAIFYMGID